MPSIEEQISQIREFINDPRKQQLLLKNNHLWNQLCSALDVVQDTDIAMEAYLRNVFPEEDGEKYIRIYGILQILVVQQDAVKHLITSLDLPETILDDLGDMREIRDIRIESIGHPTEKRDKSGYSYHFISRVTMHKGGFQLLSCLPNKQMEFKDIDIPELINKQRAAIQTTLNKVTDELKREEQEHKEKFKNESLTEIFTKANLHYVVGKVWEAIHSEGHPTSLGLMHMEIIRESLEKFKQDLEKRDLWGAIDPVWYTYKDLEYPLNEVFKYFKGEDSEPSGKERANINFFFIDKKLEELEEIAKGIDKDYKT